MRLPRGLPLAVLLTVLVALGLPGAAAGETLRSPHLTSDCDQNRPYEEHLFGPWRVEGCTETATPQNGESARRVYYGDVEVNGMIVEGTNAPLTVTVKPDGDQHINRIQRQNAKLVLDPKIGGSRRRMVIYSGNLDLKIINTPDSINNIDSPHAAIAAPQTGASGTVDIPVNGAASMLGLRIRDRIEGAKVFAGTSDAPATIEFRPPVSLGSAASALLRDWTAKIKLETVDGKGLKVDSLLFKVPDIEIPGIGGFKDLSISYSAARDEWSGSIFLDLGEPLFTLDLDMSVSASTGAPTRIAGSVGNLNIPIGSTGIFLQKVSALFNNNPLTMGVGAEATAGPQFGNFALVEIGGNLELQLEPSFRLEASGSARVLPTDADSQLAKGSMHVIIDSDGFISIGGNAEYRLVYEPLDLGASVDIGGSGAYSTNSDVFDIEAHATGTAHLWIFGDIDVVSFEAVVSSNGWGFCGTLPFPLSFVNAGIGQRWDNIPSPLLSCEMSKYKAVVPGAHKAAQTSGGTSTFTLPRGVKEVGVELTADGPEPKLTLTGPNGKVLGKTDPTGTRGGPRGAVVAPPGSNVQYFFAQRPPAGTYTVTSAADAPQLTGLRLARDVPPLKGKVTVARVKGHPGRRSVHVTGIDGSGDDVTIGVQTPGGIVPLGLATGGSFTGQYDELATGARTIVAGIERDGIPIPGRTRVIAHFKSKLPGAPRKLSAVWKGTHVLALAKEPASVETPNLWQYVLRVHGRPVALRRAKPGKPALFTVDAGASKVTVTARPVIRGRALRGKAKIVAVHRRAAHSG
jgi:hypothetical protein